VVIDGWIFLQVARQIDSDAVAPVPVSVDYQLARIKGTFFREFSIDCAASLSSLLSLIVV
jgi:hypothetical protein